MRFRVVLSKNQCFSALANSPVIPYLALDKDKNTECVPP